MDVFSQAVMWGATPPATRNTAPLTTRPTLSLQTRLASSPRGATLRSRASGAGSVISGRSSHRGLRGKETQNSEKSVVLKSNEQSPTAAKVGMSVVSSSTPQVVEPAASWKCGCCGYHLLAMDHNGLPLPLDTDAFGNQIPVHCSRCHVVHNDWVPIQLFDRHGDHANISGRHVNKVRYGAKRGTHEGVVVAGPPIQLDVQFDTTGLKMDMELPPFDSIDDALQYISARPKLHHLHNQLLRVRAEGCSFEQFNAILRGVETKGDDAPATDSRSAAPPLPPVLQRIMAPNWRPYSIDALEPKDNQGTTFYPTSSVAPHQDGPIPDTKVSAVEGTFPAKRYTYQCGKCRRNMMRMDSLGDLIPLDRDLDGYILPYPCPGCNNDHSDWHVVPLRS